MIEHYHDGDHLGATCGVCGVRVEEPLTGERDHGLEQAAQERILTWLDAHFSEFHPEYLEAARNGKEER